jgi:tRNA-binding protein
MDTLNAFGTLDIRVGTVVDARRLEGVRKAAFELRIDFGPSGTKQSAAQITDLYDPAQLVGKKVLAVVNLPPKRIGAFVSEALVLGVPDEAGRVVLAVPERPVPNGAKLF